MPGSIHPLLVTDRPVPRPVRAVLFDLDGTLADTLFDIADAMNRMLTQYGLPAHSENDYRHFVGDGVRQLIERALPTDRTDLLEPILAAYLPYLAEHGADHATLYPGIAEMLDALVKMEIPIAVCSNKVHDATRLCIDKLCAPWNFAEVRGATDGIPKKPDPQVALEIAGLLDAAAGDCLFVGDTNTDMKTANNAGMFAVGCTWGFRDRAELLETGALAIIDEPMQLMQLIG